MQHLNRRRRSAGYWLSAAILSGLALAGAEALADPADPINPLKKRFLTGKPLDICDQGAFFIGGVPKITNFATSTGAAPAQVIIGQSYVQFQIPTKRRKWPIVMIHGSAHTGAALDATAHGTEGWLSQSMRNKPGDVRHGSARPRKIGFRCEHYQ